MKYVVKVRKTLPSQPASFDLFDCEDVGGMWPQPLVDAGWGSATRFEGLGAPRAYGTGPCRSGAADAKCGLFFKQLLVEHVVEQVIFMPKIALQQRLSRRASVAEPQMVEELRSVLQSQVDKISMRICEQLVDAPVSS